MTTTPMNAVKKIVKRGLQATAARLGPHTRKASAPSLLVLMYHRILPASDPRSLCEEPGMTVTPESFRNHLSILSQYFDFINLYEWISQQKKHTGRAGNLVAITFDDGWADNYEFAFPILQEMSVPATIFLVSDMIGTQQQFWPERLAQLLITIARDSPEKWSHPELQWLKTAHTNYDFSSALPDREQISEIIAGAKSFADAEILSRLAHINQLFGLQEDTHKPALLDWSQISEMVDSGLIEMGSHTCEHTRLDVRISSERLEREVVNSKTTIETKTGQTVKTFCFPNGDYTEQALELVRQHYAGAVTTANGWNRASTDRHLLHRIGIHEDIAKDRTAFLARISGWL